MAVSVNRTLLLLLVRQECESARVHYIHVFLNRLLEEIQIRAN